MALAKKCDRCGGLYEPKAIKYDGESFNGVALVTKENESKIHYTTVYKDLCPGCIAKIKNFLKAEERGNGAC